MQIKQKNKPTFKLKYEVNVTVNKNYQFPVYVICESKSKNFLAIVVEFWFYLLENNKIIFQFKVEACDCCFSDDEKYFAIIFFLKCETKVMLLDLEKKLMIWVQNTLDFCKLPHLNFYRNYLIFMGRNQLFRYSIDGQLQIFQIFQRKVESPPENHSSSNDSDDSSDESDDEYLLHDYQADNDSESFQDRITYEARVNDYFFLYTQNLDYKKKHCYIFNPINLKISKSFVSRWQGTIMRLQNNIILQTQFGDDTNDNLFFVRNVISNKILRIQKCNSQMIQHLKIIPIKMAIYCFNLGGFYKIDFSIGRIKFYNLSYPSFLYNSIKPCNWNYLSEEPYFYECIKHYDKNKQQKTLNLYKFIT